jgi:hypothetical protein
LRESCAVHHGDGDGAGGDGFLELDSHGRMVAGSVGASLNDNPGHA